MLFCLLAAAGGAVADRSAWLAEMDAAASAWDENRIDDAEDALLRAIELADHAGEPAPMLRVRGIEALADLYRKTSRAEQAESLYLEAIAAWDRLLGPDQPRVGIPLHNLAVLYLVQCRTADALPLIDRQLSLWERTLARARADRSGTIRSQAELLRRCGQQEEAAALLARLAEPEDDG